MTNKNIDCAQTQYDNVCRPWFERIEEHAEKRHDEVMKLIKKLDVSIRGNGKKGLTERVALLEQSNTWGKRIAFMVIGAGIVHFISRVFG